MGTKNHLVGSLLLLSFLFACQKGSLRRADDASEAKQSRMEGERHGEEGSPLSMDPLEELPPPPVKEWGVIVRGVGVDSYAGLGFLQEFAKQHKVSRIAGTGMGCWIASSWATKNNGNYAEWHALKFESWSAFRPNLIDRLTRGAHRESVLAYLSQISSSRKDFVFEIPLECPLQVRSSSELSLARDLKLEDRLYHSFDVPDLELGDFSSDKGYRSGAMGEEIRDDVLGELSRGVTSPEEFAWIVLETGHNRRLWRAGLDKLWGRLDNGVRWVRLPIATNKNLTPAALKDLRFRRAFLLEGRRDAKSHLNNSELKDFLQL